MSLLPAPEPKTFALPRETGGRGRRSAAVAECIRDMIIAGTFESGERIGEREVTELLGVSRTPLREAFKILEAEGLVSIEPNRGARVVKLTLEDVKAAIDVMIALEGLASDLACQRATEAEIAEIEALHLRMVAAYEAGTLLEYFHLNQSIHQAIVDAAKNAPLSRIYRTECARIRRFRFAGNREPQRWARAVEEHAQILDALKRREGALLREILRAHQIAGWKMTCHVLQAELGAEESLAARRNGKG